MSVDDVRTLWYNDREADRHRERDAERGDG